MTRFGAYEGEEYGMFLPYSSYVNFDGDFVPSAVGERIARSTTILRKGARRMHTYPACGSGTGIHHYYHHSLPMVEGIIVRKCVILTRTGLLNALSASGK